MSGRVPPHDLDAEGAVLTSVLLAPDALGLVHGSIAAHHFYSDANRRVFEAALGLYAANKPVDMVSVASWLKEQQQLHAVGGMAYIMQLTNAIPAVANVAHHAAVVVKLWRVRQVIATTQSIAIEGYAVGAEGADRWIDDAEAKVLRVAQADEIDEGARMEVAVMSCVHDVGARVAGEVAATVPWRLCQLHRLTGGVRLGKVYALGGRPGMGKTSFALQEAVSLASSSCQQRGVAVFSLEMQEREATSRLPGEHEITERMLSQSSGVDSIRIATGDLTAIEMAQLEQHRDWLKQLPIYISSQASISVTGIRAQVRRWGRDLEQRTRTTKGGPLSIGLVVIDYLQIMGRDDLDKARARDDNLAFDDILKALCVMAKELGCAVLLLSQLRRPEALRKNDIYKLSDFRGSGAIEQHAYGAFAVHHDSDSAKLDVLKIRGGRVGQCHLEFDGSTTTFREPGRYGWDANF